jgi:chromosome condensin MukBEF complex kleisin-like MukF subunit
MTDGVIKNKAIKRMLEMTDEEMELNLMEVVGLLNRLINGEKLERSELDIDLLFDYKLAVFKASEDIDELKSLLSLVKGGVA